MEKKLYETRLNTLHGTIYNARYYNRALTDGEVEEIYYEEGYKNGYISRWEYWKYKLRKISFELKVKVYFAIERLFRLLGLI